MSPFKANKKQGHHLSLKSVDYLKILDLQNIKYPKDSKLRHVMRNPNDSKFKLLIEIPTPPIYYRTPLLPLQMGK